MESAEPVKVSAGTVCVWVLMAAPVKVSAGTVRFGAVALQAVVEPVPAAMLVAAQFPDVAVAVFVPAGVPAEVAPVVVVELVPAGVPALTADVVTCDPVKVWALMVPEGVMVALPPVCPTSPLATSVPRSVFPLSAVTSLNPVGQVPEAIRMMAPLGRVAEDAGSDQLLSSRKNFPVLWLGG